MSAKDMQGVHVPEIKFSPAWDVCSIVTFYQPINHSKVYTLQKGWSQQEYY